MLSIPHMIVVFVVVLVVFGPQKLPELARGLGKLMAEFRKASSDFKGAFEQEMREIERQAVLQERKRAAEAAAAAAAAAPVQPATQGTAVGAQTDAPVNLEGQPAADTRVTEALVATPVAEAVARGTDFPTGDRANGSLTTDAAATIPTPNATSSPVAQESLTALPPAERAHDLDAARDTWPRS
jgi:sec-independent protein translocase protein TatB